MTDPLDDLKKKAEAWEKSRQDWLANRIDYADQKLRKQYEADTTPPVILSLIERMRVAEILKQLDRTDAANKTAEQLQGRVARLEEALKGVIAVADRQTVEFDRAKAALADSPNWLQERLKLERAVVEAEQKAICLLALDLETSECIRIAEEVQKLRSGTSPFDSGYDLACDEVRERLNARLEARPENPVVAAAIRALPEE